MPLPTAWKPMHHVGATGRQGSDAAPCSYAQIRGPFWRCQPTRRTTGYGILSQIRCPHIWVLSEKTAPPQARQPAPGPDSRQRQVSSCNDTAALPCRSTTSPVPAISATLQPGIKSGREGLEVGQKTMHSQSVLSAAERSHCRCKRATTAMEKTEQNPLAVMRHYLSRSV